jgi:hypothetical protein
MPLLLCAKSGSAAFTRKQKSFPAPCSARYCVGDVAGERVELVYRLNDAFKRRDLEPTSRVALVAAVRRKATAEEDFEQAPATASDDEPRPV